MGYRNIIMYEDKCVKYLKCKILLISNDESQDFLHKESVVLNVADNYI